MSCYKCNKQVAAPFLKYGLHEACFSNWFGTKKHHNFENMLPHSAGSSEPKPEGDEWAEVASSFFQGKFKKYSAILGGKNYLLKVQEQEYPELPATEYLCNQIARMLEIDVPSYYLISFDNQAPTFVCENFMQKQHVSNLVHIYHFLENRTDYNCETLYKIILDKTQKMDDAKRFVEITLFDSLIGNHDRHGRNLGLIQSQNGYRLSPFYDNPSYLGIEIDALLGAQLEPRGKIATGTTEEPTIKDYIVEWKRLGLENEVINFYHKINIEVIFKEINNSFISNKRKAAFEKLVSSRYKEYSDAITER